MKTKFSKKLISLLLSVLMVVSTLPLSAMNVFAGELVNIAPQATITDYKPGTTTKTYDDNFNSGKVITDGRYAYDNNNSSAISGGKNNTNSYAYNWNKSSSLLNETYVNFEWSSAQSIAELKAYFWVDSGATKMPSSVKIRYSADGSNYNELTYSNHTSTSNRNCGTGYYKAVAEKDTLPNAGDDSTVVCSTFDLSSISSEPIKYLQLVSVRQNTNCVGLSEVEIFGETYVAPPVDPAQQAQALKEAMTAFETKVKTGANYKNIKPAYTAYVNAQKAYDTYVYGGDTSVNLTSYITALNSATNSISAWTAPTYNAYAKFSGDEDSNVYKYYKNALWVDSTNTDSTSNNNYVDGRFVRMYYQDGVYVYDGEDPIIPIMFGYDGNTHYVFYVGLYGNYTNGLEFVGPWMGADSSGNANVTVRRFSLAFANQYKAFSSTVGTDSPRVKITGGYHLFANQIRAKGSTIFNGSETSAYKQITFGNNFKIKHFNYDEPNNSKCWVNEGNLTASGNNRKLYVINYKPVKDYISNNSSKLTNIANYSEGGASDVVNNFNNIGAIDLSSITVSNISSSNTAIINLDTAIRYFSANTATQNSTQYASLRSAMNETVRTTFNGGVNDEGYTETSWNNFVTAYNNAKAVMATVNSQGYNNAAEAGSKATALTAAYNALTKCNHATTELVGAVAATCTTAGYTGDLTCTNCNEIIEKGVVIPVNKDNHATESHVGGLNGTWTHQNGSARNNHYQQCSKCKEYVYIDCKFTRVETQSTCESAGFVTYTCNECGYSYREDGDHATGHSYTGTINGNSLDYVCSNDNNHKYSVDIESYNGFVANANIALEDESLYTEETVRALKNALVNNAIEISNLETQDTINAKAIAIQTAINNLVEKTYTVTLIIHDEQTDTDREPILYEGKKFGETVQLTLPDMVVTKWIKESNESDQLIAHGRNTISHVVSGNATIYAYVATDKANANQHIVKLENRIGKVAGVMYVDNNTTITLGAENIGSMDVEKIPFYQVTGYTVDGTSVSIGGQFTVTEDVTITPIYTAQPTITVTLDSAGINFDGLSTDVRERDFRWDVKVNLTADEEMIWYVVETIDGKEVEKAVAKGTTYSFRASSSVKVRAEAVAIAVEKGATTITHAAYDKENRKVRVVASSYASETMPVVEQGLLILTSTDGTTYTKQQVIDGKKKYKASNSVDGKKEQFSFTLNVSPTSTVKVFSIVAYTTYAGSTEYSEVVTFTID